MPRYTPSSFSGAPVPKLSSVSAGLSDISILSSQSCWPPLLFDTEESPGP
jgi:hypothetical protein